LVYPYFDFLVKLLDSENNFLKWSAIITISNLSSVDSKNQFEKFFEKVNNQKKIMAFVKRQLNSTRPSVKKRAEKFMKKWFH